MKKYTVYSYHGHDVLDQVSRVQESKKHGLPGGISIAAKHRIPKDI